MNCRQFRETIAIRVERREALSPELLDHAVVCGEAECALALEEIRLLEPAVAAWNAQVPRAQLTDLVLADVSSPAPLAASAQRPREERFSASFWQVATAAAVLIVAGLALMGPSHKDAARQLADRAARHEAAPSPQQISRQYVAWAEGAGSLVADAVGAVIPTSAPHSADSMSSPRWMNDWLRRLEPAQRELNQAIMFLEESMPMGQNPAT